MFTSQTISKMAAPTGDATSDEVARCLNSLTLLNMRNIASEDVLNELMNDYFVTRTQQLLKRNLPTITEMPDHSTKRTRY